MFEEVFVAKNVTTSHNIYYENLDEEEAKRYEIQRLLEEEVRKQQELKEKVGIEEYNRIMGC